MNATAAVRLFRGPQREIAVRSKYSVAAMNDLLDRPWSHRGWTFQELVTSRNPVVVCGSKAMRWLEFLHAMLFLRYHHTEAEQRFVRLDSGLPTLEHPPRFFNWMFLLNNWMSSPAMPPLAHRRRQTVPRPQTMPSNFGARNAVCSCVLCFHGTWSDSPCSPYPLASTSPSSSRSRTKCGTLRHSCTGQLLQYRSLLH